MKDRDWSITGRLNGNALAKTFGLVVFTSLGVVEKIRVGSITEEQFQDLRFVSCGEGCFVLLDVSL